MAWLSFDISLESMQHNANPKVPEANYSILKGSIAILLANSCCWFSWFGFGSIVTLAGRFIM